MKPLLCVRYLAFVGNTLAWIIGMAAVGIFAYVPSYHSAILQPEEMKIFTVLMGISAFFVYLSGFFGCCGSVRINKTTMDVFLVLGIVTLIFLATSAIYFGVIKEKFSDGTIWDTTLTKTQTNAFQEEFKCCGFSSPSMIDGEELPLSCFSYEVDNGTVLLRKFRDGCKERLLPMLTFIERTFMSILGLGVISVVLGMLTVGKLDKQLRYQHKQEELMFQRATINVESKEDEKY